MHRIELCFKDDAGGEDLELAVANPSGGVFLLFVQMQGIGETENKVSRNGNEVVENTSRAKTCDCFLDEEAHPRI